MISLDPQVTAAVGRADMGWLTAHLDGASCPPAVLAELIRHRDPGLRLLGLHWLGERTAADRCIDRAETEALAALLPETVDGPPEIALALAELYRSLGRYLPHRQWPEWRAADLPAVVRVAWLRAEITHRPGCLSREPLGEPLYQAATGLRFADAGDPERLLDELGGSGDPVLRAAALRLCQEGLHAALLAPGRARAHLLHMLETAGPAGAAGAADVLRELGEPWAAIDAFPADRLRRFAGPDAPPEVAHAALTVAARHRRCDILLDAAADALLAPRLREHALASLGGLLGRDRIAEVTKLAGNDPLLLGGPAVGCLLGLHRRGLFPAGSEAPAIVALALANHAIAAQDVATILFTARHDALVALLAAEPGDPSWPRRLDLLVALAEQGTDLPIGSAVAELLRDAAAPEPFLDALRALRYAGAEEDVLAALPRAPAAALRALEAIGGPRTVAALEAALAGDVAPYLRPVRVAALELYWQLEEPDRRHALLRRLDPPELPARIAADLGRPDERELAVRHARLRPDRPVEALVGLARDGGAGTVPAISDVLGRVVAELAIAWTARSAGRPAASPTAVDLYGVVGREPYDGGPPASEREPVVPEEAVAAIRDLGRRLYVRGRIRPVCLLDAPGAEAAGDALVAGIALDLLDRPGLAATERAILLELLRRVPYPGTRARVHRLLRDRDRHVRKHVIALLAGDGYGAKALSATLITLTRGGDVQTVRQALLALGEVGAGWAAEAIAACLDHPTMNIKKTAAEALRRAGSPAAVPQLLAWLGRHDNPGLRAALLGALRAVLADATAATVLAAAERADTDRARDLLLDAVDRDLPADSVAALVAQGSPVGPALVARRRDRPQPPAGPGPDPDLGALVAQGWATGLARRVAIAYAATDPPERQVPALRRMLPDWLRLADAEPAVRPAVLRLVLRCCPAPWTDAERTAFARALPVLAAGLAELTREDRDGLVAMVEDAAATLSGPAALDLATRLRELPPAPAGNRSLLATLRRCGAVLTRADVERELASARLAADPWRAEVRVLREAFAGGVAPEEVRAWRETLDALIDAYPTADPPARAALLTRLMAHQPVDAPQWTIGERAAAVVPSRAPRDGDLDQPRSGRLRDRLLAMLGAPAAEQRQKAADALTSWPEPEIRHLLLRAHLRGDVDLRPTADLGRLLAAMDPAELAGTERAARLAAGLDRPELQRLIPALLHWWEHGSPATRAAAERALRRTPVDALAAALADRLDSREWGFVGLLTGRPLIRTAALSETCRRLRADGRDDLADRLVLVDGPLRPAAASHGVPAGLRQRPEVPAEHRPTRAELIDQARSADPAVVRAALTRLIEADGDGAGTADGAGSADDPLAVLLVDLLRHPEPKVRRHAHRVSRHLLDRQTYLRHTALLLDDPQPELVRTAIRTLSHAGWTPAVAALVRLLTHPDPGVRRTAAAGLARLGSSAVPALTHAAGRARPDRRRIYTDVLARLGPA